MKNLVAFMLIFFGIGLIVYGRLFPHNENAIIRNTLDVIEYSDSVVAAEMMSSYWLSSPSTIVIDTKSRVLSIVLSILGGVFCLLGYIGIRVKRFRDYKLIFTREYWTSFYLWS